MIALGRQIKGLNELQKDRLYTVKELLEFIPVSKSKLYSELKNVPCVDFYGRITYLGEDVLKFIHDKRN